MLRKLGFMTRCVLQDCIIAAVFHHRSAVIRNTNFPYNGLAARRALYEFAANDLPSSFKNAGVCEILTPWNSASVSPMGLCLRAVFQHLSKQLG